MFKIGSLLLLALNLVACDDFTGNSEKDKSSLQPNIPAVQPPPLNEVSNKLSGKDFSKKLLVQDIIGQVMNSKVKRFVESSNNFAREVKRNCQLEAAASSNSQKEHSIVLKFLWRSAMESYHGLEVMQLGVLAENNFALLDNLYSYPSTNRCGIDIELFKKSTQSDYQLPEATNRLGLDAIEYLLFKADLNPTCASNSRNLLGWESLSDVQKGEARCLYIKDLAQRLESDTYKLQTKWNEYLSNLSTTNESELLNQIFFALFYIEKQTKDQLLGVPTGLTKGSRTCFGKFCPNNVQHANSKFVKQTLIAHIKTFQDVFEGTVEGKPNAFGLVDYLKSFKNKFSDKIINNVRRSVLEIETALTSLPNDYDMFTELQQSSDYTQCLNSNSKNRNITACSLYEDFKKITEIMKKEFTVAFSIKLPIDTEGDGD